jgi:hypothetical protein
VENVRAGDNSNDNKLETKKDAITKWTCDACTVDNDPTSYICHVCDTPNNDRRTAAAVAAAAAASTRVAPLPLGFQFQAWTCITCHMSAIPHYMDRCITCNTWRPSQLDSERQLLLLRVFGAPIIIPSMSTALANIGMGMGMGSMMGMPTATMLPSRSLLPSSMFGIRGHDMGHVPMSLL